MTSSSRKIAANRRNAQLSTGPRTAKGKARSKLNSLLHGLAATPAWTVAGDADVERLAVEIAGPKPNSCRWHFALIAAQAELTLRKVRAVRFRLIVELSAEPMIKPEKTRRPKESTKPTKTRINLLRLDRHEQRALSRRDRALRLL